MSVCDYFNRLVGHLFRNAKRGILQKVIYPQKREEYLINLGRHQSGQQRQFNIVKDPIKSIHSFLAQNEYTPVFLYFQAKIQDYSERNG